MSCECGCGRETKPALSSDRKQGRVKGQLVRFVKGHNSRGARNPRWNGGVWNHPDGYRLLLQPDGTYRMEHRIIVGAIPGESVHHINGIRDDNRLENLQVYASHSEHIREAHC